MAGTQTEMGFGALRATTSVLNAHSAGGTSQSLSALSARGMLSGALAAGTLLQLVNVPAGAGRLSLCAVITNDSTSRTVRLRVTVDGVVVFNATSGTIVGGNAGIFAAGAISSGNILIPGDAIVYTRSLAIEIASSLAETDKLTLYYAINGS